jgi:hypothetical protein
MKLAVTSHQKVNRVELAILAKWTLQETWLCCKQVLQQDFTNCMLSVERRKALEEMYAAFYHQAFYTPVQTHAHIEQLLKNTRAMLSLLKELDANAWMKFMHENFHYDAS